MQKLYIFRWFLGYEVMSDSCADWVKNRHEKSKKKLCNCGVNYIKIVTSIT
jgi:hypothetical protein